MSTDEHYDDIDEFDEDAPISVHLKNIVGGVATLVLLCVPILLIRHVTKRIEEGEAFKKLEDTLS